MYISINDISFLLLLLIFLIIVYRRIIYGTDLLEPIKQRYSEYYRKTRINNYIEKVSKQPVDIQKMVFKEGLILTAVLCIMFLLAAKAVFFTAVASESMYPTYNKDDLVLMQNIDGIYMPGDIIMFKRPDTSLPVTHRITSITEDGIRTAGDATGQSDWWEVKKEDILGKAILIQGKPVVIKGYGKFFIVEDKNQDFGPFGKDYKNYFLFIEIIKIYGYVIALLSLFLYIFLTIKKPRQSR
jgi:signal peptidase